MSLAAGTRLGPYEIQSAIGAGGMGEVYKARDTRLDRTVAIKVLPPDVSADAERRARFEREAKTVAGLSHPHICPLFDVGEHGGSLFLVMEHLAGQTLAERLEKGPLPLEQALTIATEVAEALSAAHRQGVIHRDLKPANVMLTKAGAKLLDFGLAKLTGHGDQPAAAYAASAVETKAAALTGQGVIVGTLQYMAPEQLEGKTPDPRTDLWALGAVLYEMVTGKRAFEGKSAVSVMSAIMDREPAPIAASKPLTPSGLDRIVRRCLAKAPDGRPDSAHDVADDLRWIAETLGADAARQGRHSTPRRTLSIALFVAALILSVGAGAIGVMWLMRPSGTAVAHVALPLRPAEDLGNSSSTPGGTRTALTWTPDGQSLVFVGRQNDAPLIYVRPLDADEARPLKGTEGAYAPAVSPDGTWVAFWAKRTIRKVLLAGGPVVDVAEGGDAAPWGLVWGADGAIYWGRQDGVIWQIPADGAPRAVTKRREGEFWHASPWPLPGGRVLLYTVRKRVISWGDEQVVAQTIATGERKVLLRDATEARFVDSGHLLFLRRGVLYAVPFDPENLRLSGPEVPVVDPVAQSLTSGTGAGQYAVARTGTLAWVAKPVVPFPDGALVTVDRHGVVEPLPAPVHSYAPRVRLSPDGRRLAVGIQTTTEVGMWVYDLERDTLTSLIRDGESYRPLWSGDGKRLFFNWQKNARNSLVALQLDASAPPVEVAAGSVFPSSWCPDGRTLVAVGGEAANRGIVAVTTEGPSQVHALLDTPANETWPELSRDGRWLAYGSDATSRYEVYYRPYAGSGRGEQVSIDGGTDPCWHPSGRELFFVGPPDTAGKRRMMAVEFEPGPPPRIGRPRTLFDFDGRTLQLASGITRSYDLSANGERFYAVKTRPAVPAPPITHVDVIMNWLEDLKQKVPIR